ncbi:MAG: outer membrane protein assembly factor BamD [Ferrovum sp.]|nr:outer membrane protein assembly factor BamD [Ferrovum sp.]NDU87238.1 outer membrane protein assembly factor BamD [Ferrovum sp.]
MKALSVPRKFLLLAVIALVGCSDLEKADDPTKNWSAAKLHSEAKKELQDGNYEQAAKLYESLQSRYPYGTYSTQSELEQIYVYYKQHESASAVSEADRFIKAHPNHPAVDYAYYMKGLANFSDDLGLFGIYTDNDLVQRDMKPTKDSFDAFRDLITRFPNSRYTPDAIVRMKYLVNALARNHVAVARYYFRRQAYLAAANRAQQVLREFPRSSAQEDALDIMARSYNAMGLKDLSQDTVRVLKQDFPNSRYLSNQGTLVKSPAWWRFWQTKTP